MKKTYLYILAISFTVISCHRQTFDEKVMEEAVKFNEEDAPRRIDKCTVIDSMTYNPKKHLLTYHYTLEGDADNEEIITKEVREDFRAQLAKEVKGSIQLKPYKEQGLSFEYRYVSKKTGKILVKERFTRKDY